MAVAFDAKTAAYIDVSAATLTVNNLTVGSGSNRALILQMIWANSAVPAGVTAIWDSGGTNQALTLIPGTSGFDAAHNDAVAMYGLVAPTSGLKNLVVSWTGSFEAHAVAISFTGVDQTSVAVAFPHGATNIKTTAAAGPCSVTVTSAAGNMVTAGHLQQVTTWGAVSGTTLASQVGGPAIGSVSNYDVGAATVTLTAAFTGTDGWASFGCDVLAAAGAPALVAPLSRPKLWLRPWTAAKLVPSSISGIGPAEGLPPQGNLALSSTAPIITIVPLSPNITPASANLSLSGNSPISQLSGAGVPTLVWGVGSTTNDNNGIDGNGYKFSGVNPTLSGNALVLTIAYPYKSGRTIAISDSTGDTWPASTIKVGTASLTNLNVSTFVLPNASVGLHTLTITFDASIRVFQYALAEFYNLATASLADGSAGTPSDTGPAVAATSYTPTTNNDANGGHLIWTYAISNDTVGTDPANKASAISASGTAKLLHADNSSTIPSVSSYDIQTTNGAINPGFTITQSSATNFICSSVALKAFSAGTAPAAGIRVVRILHCTEPAPTSGNNVYLFPSDGNLLVATMAPGSDLNAINSVTDSNGQTYTDASITAGTSRVFYKENATSSNALRLTLNLNAGEPQFSLHLFDVVGAATNSFDTSNSVYTAAPGSGTVCNDLPDFTPTSSPGLTIVNTGFGTGPTTGLASGAPAGAIYDLVYYTGMTDQDRMDNADGFAHYYHSTNAAQAWNWTITSASWTSTAFATAASFKSAPLGISIVPPQGNLALSPTAETVVTTANRNIIPLQGNLALSPTAETVVRTDNHPITVLQGNLALSPTAETVAWTDNRSLVPLQGNLTLSPTAETVVRTDNHPITVLQGNLALSPTAESVQIGFNLVPLQGNLALSPTAETVVTTANFAFTIPQGNLALSPTASTVVANFNRVPLQGNLALSPTASTTVVNYNLVPLQGNLALSPTAPAKVLNYNFVSLQGNLALSPTAPTLAQTANFAFTVPQGNVALSSNAPDVQTGAGVGKSPPQGDLVLSPTAPTVARTLNVFITVPQGNLALSPTAETVVVATNRQPLQGNLALSPTAPASVLSVNYNIVPLQGNLALSPTPSSAVRTANFAFTVPQGNVALSPTVPSVQSTAGLTIIPSQGNLALSPTASAVVQTFNRFLVPLQGNLALSPTAATVQTGASVNITPPQGNLALSPTAETVALSNNWSPVPLQGNLALSPTAPTVAQTFHRNITVPQGNAALSPTAPTTGGVVNRVPSQGNLALSPTAPIVVTTANHLILPLQGNLVLSPTPPTCFASDYHPITVPQGSLVLSTLPAQLVPGTYQYPPHGDLILSASQPTIAVDRLHHWRQIIGLQGNVDMESDLKGTVKTGQSLAGSVDQSSSLRGG